jgi:hypothetical protein
MPWFDTLAYITLVDIGLDIFYQALLVVLARYELGSM